jgi:hypothetical protein
LTSFLSAGVLADQRQMKRKAFFAPVACQGISIKYLSPIFPLLNLANYIYGYFVWSENQSDLGQIAPSGIIETAYANIPIRRPVQLFIDALNQVDKFASKHGIQKAGKKLRKAIEELQTALAKGQDEVIEVRYKTETLQAYVFADELGGETVQKLRNFMGSKNIGHAELYKVISELPLDQLRAYPEVEEGLRKVFNQLDTTQGKELIGKAYNTAWNKSHGAANEIHLIHYYSKIPNSEVIAVQSREIITNSLGKPIGARVFDAKVKINDFEYFFDSKAWAPNEIQ